MLDKTRLEDLERVGQVLGLAEKVHSIEVLCSDIQEVDSVKESVKVVDPRFTTVDQSASLIAAALRGFPNIKRLSFSSLSVDMTACEKDSRGHLIDHSEAFDAVMMAAELCGYQLEEVDGLRFSSRHTEYDTCEFAGILRNNRSLSALKRMDLDFEFPFPLLADEMLEFDGTNFGLQVAMGLNQLKSLTSLRLELSRVWATNSIHMSRTCVKSLQLPALAKLHLEGIECLLDELWQLLYKHQGTIRDLEMVIIKFLAELEKDQVGDFLANMRDELELEALSISFLRHTGGMLGFPGVSNFLQPADEDFLGCVELCSRVEVQDGLTAMLDGFVMNYEVNTMAPLERDEDADENEQLEPNLDDGEEDEYDEDECDDSEYEEGEDVEDDDNRSVDNEGNDGEELANDTGSTIKNYQYGNSDSDHSEGEEDWNADD